MNKKKLISNILLVVTAFIWGSAFVAQSEGMKFIKPFTYNAMRNIIGAIVLVPCIIIFNKANQSVHKSNETEDKKMLLLGGILCGCALFLGSTFQQFGIQYTTTGKSGFITALYIIIVPILGIFLNKKASIKVWISVVVAIIGFYFLCIQEGFSIGKGDLLTLVCAVAFSFHIIIIDYFSPKVNGIKLSCLQFLVCGILSLIFMSIFESPKISNILDAWLPICYSGVLSCGVAYTLQIVAQKNTDPVIATLIMSLESVFAALSGWVILGQKLSTRELLGCALVFIAIIYTQLPSKKIQKTYK